MLPALAAASPTALPPSPMSDTAISVSTSYSATTSLLPPPRPLPSPAAGAASSPSRSPPAMVARYRTLIVLRALQVQDLHILASLLECLAWIMTFVIGSMLFAHSGNTPLDLGGRKCIDEIMQFPGCTVLIISLLKSESTRASEAAVGLCVIELQ